MVGALRSQLDLDTPGEDGVTKRKHLQQIQRQTGKRPAALKDIEIPEGGEYIWEVFWRMRRKENLSYQDIAAYHSVTGIRLKSWEVEALFRMDQAVSQFIAERMRNA